MNDLVRVRRALLSVSDKTGLVHFAKALHARGVELISTGGTSKTLRDAGLPVTSVEDLTGQPEILSGRVKTLHPSIHGGILAIRGDADHMAQIARQSIAPIDLVCVNLYPFEQTVAKPGVSLEDAIENIDIGGPSMVRSAAKNHADVAIVTAASQYEHVLEVMSRHDGQTTHALRAELARQAFAMTARYDAAIASYLSGGTGHSSFPALMTVTLAKVEDLRYGENPHQDAALYRMAGQTHGPSLLAAEQLHGKELSFNNINDANAALQLALSLSRLDPTRVAAAVVKHTNPCGASLVKGSVLDAVDEAIAGDPVAAYGGILAVSDVVDMQAAERLCAKDIFLEVLIAPGFEASALEALRDRWANIRLLATGAFNAHSTSHERPIELRFLDGGALVQHRDESWTESFEHKAGPKPEGDTIEVARFLEVVVRFLFSNAIVLGGTSTQRPGAIRMFGAGAGQMDRVTACGLAVGKAGNLAEGAVAFSDAFFPFSDGPQLLIDAGVKTIVHPGGSKRDGDTFLVCDKHHVTCLKSAFRHFRH
jgi:phosphoribosylaminoimidazolecarboxamide formyltransferase/IMP cyclohydrolase